MHKIFGHAKILKNMGKNALKILSSSAIMPCKGRLHMKVLKRHNNICYRTPFLMQMSDFVTAPECCNAKLHNRFITACKLPC